MTVRGDSRWTGFAAPAVAPPVDGATGPGAPHRGAADAAGIGYGDGGSATIEDLESDVYAARDLHGEERGAARRVLNAARSRLSDDTYRRALVLARDSALLSLEECLDGARAMEWRPMPRPEFSLAAIEAAVAEQERAARAHAEFGSSPI